MGIFDLFRSQPKNINQQHEPKDERKAECPNCHKALSKIPGAKTKCPHCGEFMFVRTRPKDEIRVVVTKAEADKIDEEWTIVAGTHEIFIAEKEEFEKEKSALSKKFKGKYPSDNDVRWSLSNRQLLEHMRKGDWGLYRNTRFNMAEILRGELKLKDALKTYFEVCYLDLNGVRNLGGVYDPELLKDFPQFDPKNLGFLAPGIVSLIEMIIKKLKISEEESKSFFIEQNSQVQRSLKLPLLPSQCWDLLHKEIGKNNSIKNTF